MRLTSKLSNKMMAWLNRDSSKPCFPFLSNFEEIKLCIRPGDVLLIEGRSRISKIISLITHSPWSHVALYIGYLENIKDPALKTRIQEFGYNPKEQLFIESVLGKGVIVTPLSKLEGENVRLCRPKGLSAADKDKVIEFAIKGLGVQYDTRQIFDLARLLFPWRILPRRWRSSLFTRKLGTPTKLTCSLLIAEAFASVHFPILPFMQPNQSGSLKFIQRHP